MLLRVQRYRAGWRLIDFLLMLPLFCIAAFIECLLFPALFHWLLRDMPSFVPPRVVAAVVSPTCIIAFNVLLYFAFGLWPER